MMIKNGNSRTALKHRLGTLNRPEINKSSNSVFLCPDRDTEERFTVKGLTQIITDMAYIRTLHILWKTQPFPLFLLTAEG